ncbi:peptidoglycan-binding protein [Halobellus sp. Atlit-31R]|nr:peptidoglycan-binding protein [Halobellus sp. Atlit-31R]
MQPVETSDPEGVDYGWVMQTTFVLTIVVGAPVVAALSVRTTLPTWGARVEFAIRVGAVVWIVVALAVFFYARRFDAGDGGDDPDELPEDGD